MPTYPHVSPQQWSALIVELKSFSTSQELFDMIIETKLEN